MEPVVLVPFPGSLADRPTATHVRSTLLVSSLHAVRRRGLFDAYAAKLPRADLDEISTAVAGVWLPIRLGVAHYRTCDALELSASEHAVIGAEVVREVQSTFIGTLLKLSASGAGITPWLGLEKFSAIYERMFQGGGVRIVKTGPKDARAEIVGLPLAAIPYFRNAYRGFIQAGCEFFSSRVYVSDVAKFCSDSALGYRISWV